MSYERLKFSYLTNVFAENSLTDEAIKAIAANCRTLKMLYIIGSGNLTDASIN